MEELKWWITKDNKPEFSSAVSIKVWVGVLPPERDNLGLYFASHDNGVRKCDLVGNIGQDYIVQSIFPKVELDYGEVKELVLPSRLIEKTE